MTTKAWPRAERLAVVPLVVAWAEEPSRWMMPLTAIGAMPLATKAWPRAEKLAVPWTFPRLAKSWKPALTAALAPDQLAAAALALW